MMTGEVVLTEGMAFEARSGSGHTYVLDSSGGVGGLGRGASPMESVLLGLGGCTAMDVISILRKMRQDVTDYRVRLEAERATEHPKVFTDITVEHVVEGRGLSVDMVRRAVELSSTRYCSVSAMLKKAVPIHERYRVVDATTGDEQVGDLAAEPAAAGSA